MVILLMRIWNIADLAGPVIFNDEMGYWSHAANMMGLPWKNTEDLWYSYGYSLILMPFFLFTHNMNILYRIAIVINGLFGVGSFLLGIQILKKLKLECSDIAKILISFTAACYSAYLFQSNIAWAESLVYFLFILLLYAVLCFVEHPSYKNSVFVSLGVVFLYITHNRTIAVGIAFFMMLCYMLWDKKICWKQVSLIVSIIAISFVFDDLMRANVSILMWGREDAFVGNDISTNIDNLFNVLFTMEGRYKLLLSLAGKLWYVFTSTLSLAFFGVIYLVKKWIICYQENRKELFFYFFLIFSFLGVLAISTIAMIPLDVAEGARIDIAFYGRYTDMISGILIICGLLEMQEIRSSEKRYIKEILFGAGSYLFCTIILFGYVKEVPNAYINKACVPGLYFFSDVNFIGCCDIVLIMLLIFGLYTNFFKKSKKGWIMGILIEIGIISIFLIDYYHVYQSINFPNVYSRLTDVCNVIADNPEYDLFYSGSNYSERQVIRSRATENNMYFEEPYENAENFFYVINWDIVKNNLEEYQEYYYVMSFGADALLINGKEINEALSQAGFKCFSIDKMRSLDETDILAIEVIDKGKILQKTENSLAVMVEITVPEDVLFINDKPYRLAYHVYDINGNIVQKDGIRTDFNNIKNGDLIEMVINTGELEPSGKYLIEIDIVQEGVAWISSRGLKTVFFEIVVPE